MYKAVFPIKERTGTPTSFQMVIDFFNPSAYFSVFWKLLGVWVDLMVLKEPLESLPNSVGKHV